MSMLSAAEVRPFRLPAIAAVTGRVIRCLLVVLAVAALSACAGIAERASSRFADNLGVAVFDHDDPATVADGLPAYLLLLDGLIVGSPDSADLLRAASGLYSAYAGSFVDDPERAGKLSARGLDYARRATCINLPALCARFDQRVDEFIAEVDRQPASGVATLYTLGSAWSGYVQANSDDFGAIAELPMAQALLERVVALDPGYERGLPWTYLGVLHSLRPAAVGGQPERGKAAFEQAIARSNGDNLMAKVLYARHYARLVFDRELHDRLLIEVRDADGSRPGFTLINTLAKRQGAELLASADDYF